MYVFDIFFVIDILFGVMYKFVGWMEAKRYWKPQALWKLAINIISTIPAEIIYTEIYSKANTTIHAVLKLRCLFRIYRVVIYAIEMRTNVGLNNLLLSIIEVLLGYYLILVVVSLILFVTYEPGAFGTASIMNIMSYIMYKSTGFGFELISRTPLYIFIKLLPFNAIAFLHFGFGISLTTCALLQMLRPKMVFANTISMWVAIIKTRFKGKDKDAFLRTLDIYSLYCWKKREKLSKIYTYDTIITKTMTREIKLDLCFNALKHSNLFRRCKTNVLRYISTLMSITFMTPGELVYKKHKFHTSMIYVITGIIQLLSQEDGETPILSLSGGTVLGETALFLSHPCPCTVMCQSYCELIILKKIDFGKLSHYYPTEYLTLLNTVKMRYTQARLYIKVFSYELMVRESSDKREVLTLKWLKSITKKLYRKTDFEEEEVRKIKDRKHQEIFHDCLFVTYYLDQIILTEDIELNTQAIMYKKKFPFIFLPNTVVGWLWDQMIAVLAMVHSIFYVFHVCTSEEYFTTYSFVLCFITVLWMIDVYIQISTAIRTKDVFIAEILSIILIRLQEPCFWVDVIAAFPIDGLIYLIIGPVTVQATSLYQINRLFKCYRLFSLFSTSEMHNSDHIVRTIRVRHVVTILIGTLNITGILYLISCYNFDCNEVFENFLLNIKTTMKYMTLKFIVSFYFAVSLVSGVNFEIVPIAAEFTFLFLQFVRLLSHVYFTAELSAVKALKNDRVQKNIEFKKNIESLTKIWSLDEKIVKRMIRYFDTHSEKKAITSNLTDISKQLPSDMYKIAARELYSNLQEYLPILKYLPEGVTTKISASLVSLTIPPDEVVIYHGEVCQEMYIIEAGFCKIFYPGGVTKLLGPGDVFCVYETCKRTPSMVNVVSLTHVKVLTLNYPDYIKAFGYHPHMLQQTREIFNVSDKLRLDAYDYLENIDAEQPFTDKTPSFKLFSYKLRKDTPEGEDYHIPFNRNDFVYYLKFLLLRVTFRCGGKFCFYWEISRCFFAFIAVTLSPVGAIATSGWTYNSFIILATDITAYIDIYYRHHVSYYNDKNIEITHPLKTAGYYWKHSLLMDLLGVICLNKILPFILRMKTNSTVQTILQLNRLIQYYRIHIFLKRMAAQSGKRVWIFIRYFLQTIFIVNIIASVLVLTNCEFHKKFPANPMFDAGIQCIEYSFLRPKFINSFSTPYSAIKVHCLAVYFVASLLTGAAVNGFKLETGEIYIQVSVLCLFGIFYFIHISTTLIATYLLRNVDLINYQSLLYELVKFLNYRKIDNKLRVEVIEHFEFVWRKKQGKNEQDIFQKFNSALEEDALYDMYGKILHEHSVFTNASRSFYKSLLHNVMHKMFLNLGIVVRINQCHPMIYFLVKGTIDVLGPDYNHLLFLPVGSMFGSLDNTPCMRQTLTMVAKGHVELLAIPNNVFHLHLARYEVQKEQYKHLTMFHTDYLVGTKSDANVKTLSMNTEILKKWDKYSKGHMPKFFKHVHYGKYVKIWKGFDLIFVCCMGFILELYQINACEMNLFFLLVLYAFDSIFLVNVYLNFHFSFHNEYGIEVKNLHEIARRYMKKPFGFWMDISTLIPFEIFSIIFRNSKFFVNAFSFGRINRLLRIIHVIRYFQAKNNKLHINVLTVRTFALICWIIVAIQLTMNIFFFLALFDPSLEHLNTCRSQKTKIFTYLEQMVVIIFMAVGTRINNFLPNYSYVLVIQSFLMVFLRFLIIVGTAEMCATMEVVTSCKSVYEGDINELKRTMVTDDLAIPLQDRAWLYVKLLWINNRGKTFPPLLAQSPYYLKEGILNSMFGYHLRKHPILKNCHVDFIRQLIAFLYSRIFVAGDYITFIGDIDGCMYFIEEGNVLVIEHETVSTQIVKHVLKAGDMFGFEQGIYPQCGHQYTYKADSYCFLLELKQERWLHLLPFFPASEFLIYNADRYLPH